MTVHSHQMKQVWRFILKKGLQEPLIISCDPYTGCAYLTEGTIASGWHSEKKIPFVPCHVIPKWLPPNGSFKNVNADLTILQSKEVILSEHLALTVLNVKQVQS